MRTRRGFVGFIVSLLTVPVVAQRAILEGREAVVCESDSVKCPNGHATCKSINAPVVVGNDLRQNPDVSQLFEYHLMRCEVCHVLFTRE
jgi:hypothetical protein